MRIPNTNKRGEQGSVLFMTIIITAVISVGLASYLQLVLNQKRSIARSASWNQAIAASEAGIEEALAQVNTVGTDLVSMQNNGWRLSQLGTEYVKVGSINGQEYVTAISVTTPPVVRSRGVSPLAGLNANVTRTIEVQTRSTGLFMKGMVARGQIDLRGNNISTDSFDSSDSSYSTGGLYDATKAKDNGDVATNSGLVNSLNVGNANIRGEVSTGPGGSVSIGPNGVVGDDAWHDAGNTGIQPGASSDDMNVSFPDVVAPFTAGLPPQSNVTVGSETYAYVLSSGDYSLNSINLTGNKNNKILVTGDARLYVNGNIAISGTSAGIEIASTGSLKLYCNGNSTSFGGNGVANYTGLAENFQYYGLPNNNRVAFNGNAAWAGTIYAPNAALTMGGGGNNTYDFVGASISNTVSMNGHFNFHYDEALANLNNDNKYIIIAWNEI